MYSATQRVALYSISNEYNLRDKHESMQIAYLNRICLSNVCIHGNEEALATKVTQAERS